MKTEDVMKFDNARKWAEIKYELMFEKNRVSCEICHVKPAEEAHHAFFGRSKRNSWVNHELNMQLVCRSCHGELADGFENRVKFANKQIRRYGRSAFHAWLDEIPAKMKLTTRYKELIELLKFPDVRQVYKGTGQPGGK